MTAEPAPGGPVAVEPPEHPLHALTTYELLRYRGQLEHALRTLPEHAPFASFSGRNSPSRKAASPSPRCLHDELHRLCIRHLGWSRHHQQRSGI